MGFEKKNLWSMGCSAVCAFIIITFLPATLIRLVNLPVQVRSIIFINLISDDTVRYFVIFWFQVTLVWEVKLEDSSLSVTSFISDTASTTYRTYYVRIGFRDTDGLQVYWYFQIWYSATRMLFPNFHPAEFWNVFKMNFSTGNLFFISYF